jgi:choline dehydrogenase-like flavoprotein
VLDPERHGPLDQYRRRRFGGTTDVWGGRCAPFDPIDFENRQHVPWSGWPINRRDLDPYYALAHVYCDLGEYTYQANEALHDSAPVIGAGFRESGVLSEFVWRFSLPTDFGRAFWNSLSAAWNVKVCLHATALQLRTSSDGESIDRLEAGAPGGKRFTVKAEYFVMATGGLEAARLLLLSRDGGTHGIGNARGLVGRFYISHITGDLGRVAFTPDAAAQMSNYFRTKDLVYCRRALSISEQKQRQERLLNFRAIVSHPPPADPSHRSGVLSAMYLAKKYLADRIPLEYSKELSDMTPTQKFSVHCRNIVTDWREVAGFAAVWMKKRILSRRKLPSVVHKNKSSIYTLHFDAEQAPNPESRVMLSDSRDEFGLNRLKVDWRCTQQDIDSVVRSAALVAQVLRESGVGQCDFNPERLGPHISRHTGVGSHHIGTTRMADSPTAGVVDGNCKVFGVENLFIASSSVFPTSSFANPTLTIVALAIRLADHLKEKQSGRFARQVRVKTGS